MCKEKEKNGRVLCNVNPPGGGRRDRKPPPMSTGFPLDLHWMLSTRAPGVIPTPNGPHTAATLGLPGLFGLSLELVTREKRLEEGSPADKQEFVLGGLASLAKDKYPVFSHPRDNTGPPSSSFLGPKRVTWHPFLLDGTDGHH